MNSKDLTYKQIFIFWLPLAATWLMMSVEGPFLSAIIARMAEPKFNLAAYGVAFSLALIVEAPIIMIMSASTALVKDNFSFRKMKTFTYTLNLSITLIMLILLIPPIFNYIAIDLINLPEKVAGLTYTAVAILLPWPGAIGYRRFYQGILIRYNLTRRVAYGTIIRLFSMSAAALIFYFLFEVDGVIVGAAALSTGVTAEGIASKLMALGTLKKLKREETPDENKLTYGGILAFYYPLALTSMLSLGVHPMVTFFIGQAPMALESLAVLPVINSLVFIFRSLGLSYQEVGIALLNNNAARYIKLRNFAIGLRRFCCREYDFNLGYSNFENLVSLCFWIIKRAYGFLNPADNYFVNNARINSTYRVSAFGSCGCPKNKIDNFRYIIGSNGNYSCPADYGKIFGNDRNYRSSFSFCDRKIRREHLFSIILQ